MYRLFPIFMFFENDGVLGNILPLNSIPFHIPPLMLSFRILSTQVIRQDSYHCLRNFIWYHNAFWQVHVCLPRDLTRAIFNLFIKYILTYRATITSYRPLRWIFSACHNGLISSTRTGKKSVVTFLWEKIRC